VHLSQIVGEKQGDSNFQRVLTEVELNQRRLTNLRICMSILSNISDKGVTQLPLEVEREAAKIALDLHT
jgi:hypothetical protein